jgi:hypothetical protein
VINSLFLKPDGWKAEAKKMRSAFGAPIDDATAAEFTSYRSAPWTVIRKP